MLGSVADAITSLTGAISGLLTPAADPSLAPDIVVRAAHAHLSGIGGFIGINATPHAETHGRVLEAQVVLRVRAATPAALLVTEASTTHDLLAADPLTLRARGVLRLERLTDMEDRELTAADGLGAPVGRELRFAVRYEHRPVPAAPEDVLGSVSQDVMTAALAAPSRLLYDSEFLTNPLADFTVFPGTGAGTPGTWTYDPATQEIRQTGTRVGGVNGLNGAKAGTYLVLNQAVTGGVLRDFVLSADVRSDGPGAIGLVFRFLSTATFGFALLEQPPPVRLFGRRTANVGALLAQGGQAANVGFTTGQYMRLRLLAQDDRFELSINGVPALSGRDPGMSTPGMVGFFCRRNATARFRRLSLRSL